MISAVRPRRALQLSGTLLIFCGVLAAFAPVQTARGDAIATVSPDSGSMQTAFTLSAAGLTPGHGIIISVFDAAGTRFTYQKDGVDQAFVTDDLGAVSTTIVPAGLGSPIPGSWRAVFQEEDTGYTATIPFDVGP